MLLRDSEYKGKADYNLVLSLACGALGRDAGGYRMTFRKLVEGSKRLADKAKEE